MATPPDAEQLARLGKLFPLLARTHFAIRGPATARYNCVAWALGNTVDVWWPDRRSYWPIRRYGVSLKVFTEGFRAVGFVPCAAPEVEPSFETIALYMLDGQPTHVARIETGAIWTSKLGLLELIEHEPDGLNGVEYGTPVHFFRKKV